MNTTIKPGMVLENVLTKSLFVIIDYLQSDDNAIIDLLPISSDNVSVKTIMTDISAVIRESYCLDEFNKLFTDGISKINSEYEYKISINDYRIQVSR